LVMGLETCDTLEGGPIEMEGWNQQLHRQCASTLAFQLLKIGKAVEVCQGRDVNL